MKQPILYSFVRFRPYVETGEFVNVGLLMCEPQRGKLTYRLVSKNEKRIKSFFYNSNIFENIREVINAELKFITSQEFNFTIEEMARFFHNYVDIKEGAIQYSNAIIGLVDNPTLYFNDLYTRYIHLGGVKSESQEMIMIKRFRDIFKAENDAILLQYKQHMVKGELAKFSLPLALKNKDEKQILKAVKPMVFDQIESPSMIEHCDNWVSKINRAAEEGLLKKENILFTLDTADTANKIKILNKIKHTFDKFKIQHIDWNENDHLLAFAKNI